MHCRRCNKSGKCKTADWSDVVCLTRFISYHFNLHFTRLPTFLSRDKDLRRCTEDDTVGSFESRVGYESYRFRGVVICNDDSTSRLCLYIFRSIAWDNCGVFKSDSLDRVWEGPNRCLCRGIRIEL